jgi:putative phosphoesterase
MKEPLGLNVLLLSDTHSYMDERILHYASMADEIWHAGDVGDVAVLDKLNTLGKPLRGVFGNIDNHIVRRILPENLLFTTQGVKVFMTHIGGKPYSYPYRVQPTVKAEKPMLYICGHSHILKVQKENIFKTIYMNPGAAGVHGFHKFRTMLRFRLFEGKIENLEVIELGERATLK